ncbi:hypothetical protein [uncultured Tenacibaculum sp.]|uniref:hypothetical protein n=1 Tax=uncultured Tenacibaculum sp. TaxID=174713 RepID=UPI00260BEC2B|nr:hypothetical protein [uncultured Tenacibaculum sp.]
MRVLVRLLYDFKDETIDVSCKEDIISSIEKVKHVRVFHVFVYILSYVDQRKSIVLKKKNDKVLVEYLDNNKVTFSEFEISSIESFYGYLDNFLEKNLNDTDEFFENNKAKKETLSKENYQKWKLKYNLEQKNERKKKWKNALIVIALSPLFIYIINLIYTGEYKFIGQKTQIVKAHIYKINWAHAGPGRYYQRLYYKYSCNNKSYNDITTINKFVGERKVGDSIVLKISESNPMRYVIKDYITTK